MYILGMICGILGIVAVLGLIGAVLGLCAKILPAVLTTGFVVVILAFVCSTPEVQTIFHELMWYLS